MTQEIRPAAPPGTSTRPVRPPPPAPRTGPLEVWKFGGSSVADVEHLDAVSERMITAHRAGRRVVAVLSAMGGATGELTRRAYAVTDRPDPRELDALLAVGESVSCSLTAMAVQDRGVRAVSLNAAQVGIVTDDRHANARLRHVHAERILAELDDDAVVLVTGFQGVDEAGDLTTLGRGGSDASAVAVAAALGAGHCTVHTDVPAVFTADPRLVPEARPLVALRPEEMLELAEAGAGVLQPRAVELAAAHDVAIHLRSSSTDEPGTWIRREAVGFEGTGVVGVPHRTHEPRHTATGVSAAGLVAALTERGATLGTLDVDGDVVRFTAPDGDDAEVAAAVSAAGGELVGREDLGSVSVVAAGMPRRPEVPARALAVLADAGVDVHRTTVTPGRVAFAVAADRVGDAARGLHSAFLGEETR